MGDLTTYIGGGILTTVAGIIAYLVKFALTGRSDQEIKRNTSKVEIAARKLDVARSKVGAVESYDRQLDRMALDLEEVRERVADLQGELDAVRETLRRVTAERDALIAEVAALKRGTS
ncbi:MAG: hypothetical protein LC798_15660 [Chloroflexi bacterium]|nr:hypothetical protein [Chloroflexota bacterium]